MEPTKAYEVERVGRTVTVVLVHAHSAAEAKERSAEHGVSVGSHTEFRGFAGVRRAEAWDGHDLPAQVSEP